MARLILASGSPQRRVLLAQAGYDFEVFVPSEAAECGICSKETPPELVARLAYQKAADVLARWTAREEALRSGQAGAAKAAEPPIIVACDTVCECQAQRDRKRDQHCERFQMESSRPAHGVDISIRGDHFTDRRTLARHSRRCAVRN